MSAIALAFEWQIAIPPPKPELSKVDKLFDLKEDAQVIEDSPGKEDSVKQDFLKNEARGKRHAVQSELKISRATAPQDAELLRQITQLYIFSHDGISPRMMAGLELPPVDFINAELERQNAKFRVRSVRGAEADTYFN